MPIKRTPLAPLRAPDGGAHSPAPEANSFASQYPDFMIEIATLRRHRGREIAKLEKMSARDQRSFVRSFLSSSRMHLLYAYEGTRRANSLDASTPGSIRELAGRCNPYHRCDERASPVWVRRNCGRERG